MHFPRIQERKSRSKIKNNFTMFNAIWFKKDDFCKLRGYCYKRKGFGTPPRIPFSSNAASRISIIDGIL